MPDKPSNPAMVSAAQHATARAIEHAVEQAMRDAWNDICADSEHHPLDIEQLGQRRLTFTPRHWTRATGARTAVAVMQMLAGPGGEAMLAAAREIVDRHESRR